MMMKKFFGRNRRLAAIIMAVAIILSGVTPIQTAEAAGVLENLKKAEYTFTFTDRPQRKVGITDGVVTLEVEGKSYQLTRPQTSLDVVTNIEGTQFIQYKNDKMYYAAWDIEKEKVTIHRLKIDGVDQYVTEFIFDGKFATHFVDNNGVKKELPKLEYLRNLLGLATPAPTFSVPPIPTPTPTVVPTLTPTVVPTLTPTVVPTPTPTVVPTPTPTVVPTPTPTVVPTPTPTVVPTPTATVSPTQTPNVIIDTDLNITTEEKDWLNKLITGEMTWREFVKNITTSNWKIEKDDHEVKQIWYVYDDAGRLVYQYEDKSGHSTESGNGNKEETGNTAGDANVEIKDKEEGGSNSNTNISGNTTITDKRPSGNSKGSKDRVKQSGGKYVWLSTDGGTEVEFTVKKGRFKFLTLNGKKIVAAGMIKKNKVIMLRNSSKKVCVISINTHKVAWLKEKVLKFCRDDNGFIIKMTLKTGKKVSVKNLAVSKGRYGKNIDKISYTISYKKLIKK